MNNEFIEVTLFYQEKNMLISKKIIEAISDSNCCRIIHLAQGSLNKDSDAPILKVSDSYDSLREQILEE